jgi:hypothetical protein
MVNQKKEGVKPLIFQFLQLRRPEGLQPARVDGDVNEPPFLSGPEKLKN